MQMPDADAAALLAAAAKRIFAVMVLILCYSLCSSMLLILNKVCSTTASAICNSLDLFSVTFEVSRKNFCTRIQPKQK